MDPLEDEILELRGKQNEINQRLQKLEDISMKPKRCQNIIEEAICYLQYKPLKDVITIFPAVKSNTKFWIELLLHSKPNDDYDRLTWISEFSKNFQKYSSIDVRKDRDLMIQLIEYGCDVLDCLTSNLRRDEKFLTALLQMKPTLLGQIPEVLNSTHATLVASTLRRLPNTKSTVAYLKEMANDSNALRFVSQNMEVALAWASAGGIYSERHSSWKVKNDHTIMLTYIKNSTDKALIPIDQLQYSNAFMIEAIKHDPRYLFDGLSILKSDEERCLAAASNPYSGDPYLFEI